MGDEPTDQARAPDAPYHDTRRTRGYDEETGEALVEWREEFRGDLRAVLGHDVISERAVADAAPERVGVETGEGHRRQEWTLATEEGFRVPFSLLLPAAGDPPYPVALTLHGHTDLGRRLAVGEIPGERRAELVDRERRDIAVQAVERGYAALAPDMRGFGDLAEHAAGDDGRACTRLQKTAQVYGRSLVGDRVWDVLRVLDFVEGNPDLDADRVAVTGHSGGGAVTLFAAALDDRVSPVAPNAYFCTFRDSILAVDHCACNYVPGVARLGEMWDLAGLIAPRPLAVATGADDPIFPVEGTRRAFERLREVYAAAGAVDRCRLHVGDGGHRFYPRGVWPFVDAHL